MVEQNPTQQTTDTADPLDLSMPAFREACGKLIVLGRQLAPRMRAGDMEAAGEFGHEAGLLLGLAGATADETVHYSQRVLAMVLADVQA